MNLNIQQKIIKKINRSRRGVIFFNEDFQTFGGREAVKKALQRLEGNGEIERIARGIYVRPKKSKVVGKVYPSIEEIARAIARRDRARIIPSGAFALNRLGLSEQVPMNVVYLTDGAPRKIKIDKRTITLKKSSPKNLAAKGEISSLLIQALKTLSREELTGSEHMLISKLLNKEDKSKLRHDLLLAPGRVRNMIYKIMNRMY